jgi:hypothetical protein
MWQKIPPEHVLAYLDLLCLSNEACYTLRLRVHFNRPLLSLWRCRCRRPNLFHFLRADCSDWVASCQEALISRLPLLPHRPNIGALIADILSHRYNVPIPQMAIVLLIVSQVDVDFSCFNRVKSFRDHSYGNELGLRRGKFDGAQ